MATAKTKPSVFSNLQDLQIATPTGFKAAFRTAFARETLSVFPTVTTLTIPASEGYVLAHCPMVRSLRLLF